MEFYGWLTRCADGRYVFSGLVPRIKKPAGASEPMVYPVVGDPFFTGVEKNWCEMFVHGAGVGPLEPLKSVPITMSVELRDVQVAEATGDGAGGLDAAERAAGASVPQE